MLTKWNMTFFLFFGMLSASMALGGAFRALQQEKPYRAAAFAGAAAAVISAAVFCFTIGSPMKIMNILGHPASGLSSAIIADILLIPAGLLLLKKRENGTISGIATAVFTTVCIYCFSRVYMIVTRPALDTPAVFLMFLFLCMYIALFLLNDWRKESFIFRFYVTAVSAYCITAVFFLYRVGSASVHDRVLQLPKLLSGDLACLFWSSVVVTLIAPAAALAVSFIKVKYRLFVFVCGTAGLFLLSMLVNQMPVVSRGVEGRFFY